MFYEYFIDAVNDMAAGRAPDEVFIELSKKGMEMRDDPEKKQESKAVDDALHFLGEVLQILYLRDRGWRFFKPDGTRLDFPEKGELVRKGE